MNDIVYLYGFVGSDSSAPPRALSGVHGAAVSLLDVGDGISAAISRVPAEEFSPDVIDANIQDLNWVGARGMEHERVVAWFVDNSSILPVSLFTLFSTATALTEDVARRVSALKDVMSRLHDHREWDLKVSYDESQFAKYAGEVVESIRAIDAEIAQAAPGRKFLLEKKRKDVLKRDLGTAARDRARDALDVLAVHAADAVTLPMPRNENLPVVLNAALLVTKSKENELRAAASDVSEPLEKIGMHLHLTGPWAPYRFMEAADE